MKKSNLKATIGLAACLLAVPALNASTMVNMTGCLARGANHHEYTATDGNGQTFGLRPGPGINMKKHVGQEVMITGDVIKAKKEHREAAKNGTPAENEYLRVTQLKKVSNSCQ
jgi:hypothetical protein